MYDMTMHRSPLAEWIYEFRVRLDLTQREFAEHMDIAVGTVKSWERGRQIPRGPTMLLFQRIAREIGFHEPPPVIQPRKENQIDTNP